MQLFFFLNKNENITFASVTDFMIIVVFFFFLKKTCFTQACLNCLGKVPRSDVAGSKDII